jgi:hypothetical protein
MSAPDRIPAEGEEPSSIVASDESEGGNKMRKNRLGAGGWLWLLAGAAACADPARVQACGLETRDGNVQLHSTSGWPSRVIEVPEGQMLDSINTGRWVHRCGWVEG